MPKDSNDTEDIDKILAELKNESVEESKSSKKVEKKEYKNDDYHEYDVLDADVMDDSEW